MRRTVPARPGSLRPLPVGGIIGAGVFVLTGVAAREFAGPAVVLSYLLSAFASFLAALCYTEFAVALPVAGSAYNYVAVTYGELPAFLCGCDLVLEYTISAAAVARGWTSYAATLVGLPSEALRVGIGSLRLDFLAVYNIGAQTAILCRGIKESSNFNMVVNAINLLCIAFVLIAGYSHIDTANYKPFAPHGVSGVLSGASICFFSFIGFDTVATAAEEVRNPGRDLPLGIIGSLAICTLLYVGMCAVITGMVPTDEIDLAAPFAVAFRTKGMAWAESIVSAGALTGITTSLLVSLLGQPRIYMTMSRDGLLPPFFGKVDAKRGTPVNASIVTGVSAGLMAFLVDIDALAQLVSIGTLCVFSFVCSACLARRYLPPDGVPMSGPGEDEDSRGGVRSEVLHRVGRVVIGSLGLAFCTELLGARPFLLVLVGGPFALLLLISGYGFTKLPQRCIPEKFAVPLMPFVPCLGVYACCQLIASLGPIAWLRFFVYYTLCGLIYCYYRGGVDPAVVEEAARLRAEGAGGEAAAAAAAEGVELQETRRGGAAAEGETAGLHPHAAEAETARLLPAAAAHPQHPHAGHRHVHSADHVQ